MRAIAQKTPALEAIIQGTGVWRSKFSAPKAVPMVFGEKRKTSTEMPRTPPIIQRVPR